MNEKWIWLPDWASNLGVWEDDLADVASAASHDYVPYGQMADFLEHPMDLPDFKKASTVVAWGLGALSLMCSAAGPQKGQKWILLSPYADFCDEIGHWTVPPAFHDDRTCSEGFYGTVRGGFWRLAR